MNEVIHLQFHGEGQDKVLLPEQCSLSVACYESEEVREAVAMSIEQILYALALVGMDLRALDGITMSHDCGRTQRHCSVCRRDKFLWR